MRNGACALNESEKEIIKNLYISGIRVREIGKQIKRADITIIKLLKEINIYDPAIKHWTKEEDDKLLDLKVNKKFSYTKISEILNMGIRRVKNRCDKLDICKRHNILEWTKENNEKLIDLIDKKLSILEISKIFNCDALVISKRCKHLNLNSKARKLIYTEDQLNIIKEFYLEGRPDIITAAKVNLSVDTIKHIRRKEKIQNKKMESWTDEDDNLLINMLKNEDSLIEMRRRLQRSGTQIMQSIKRLIPIEKRNTYIKKILYTITKYYTTDVIKTKLYNAQLRCKDKGWEYNLDEEFIQELFEKQNGLCFYTGEPLEINAGTNKFFSIDRINSLKGYVKDNVALCTWEVNRFKSNLSIKRFKELCHLIENNSPLPLDYEI